MTNNFKMFAIIIVGIIILFIFNFKNSDYNFNKTVSACMVAQKKISKSINVEEVRKFCEEKIKKMVNNSK